MGGASSEEYDDDDTVSLERLAPSAVPHGAYFLQKAVEAVELSRKAEDPVTKAAWKKVARGYQLLASPPRKSKECP